MPLASDFKFRIFSLRSPFGHSKDQNCPDSIKSFNNIVELLSFEYVKPNFVPK